MVEREHSLRIAMTMLVAGLVYLGAATAPGFMAHLQAQPSSDADAEEGAESETATDPDPSADPSVEDGEGDGGGDADGEAEGSDGEEAEQKDDSSADDASQASDNTPEGMPSPPEIPSTADEPFSEELKEYRTVYGRYASEIQDYQGTIDSIVDAEFNKRRSRINEKFDRKADELQAREREERNGAIEKFERFLKRHPNHPRYTPDAMFRLAELYFEQENDEYLLADERYQKEMERYRAGRRPSPPKAPTRDYNDTIRVFSDLISAWPDYRLLDGAYYLLAYCHQQMGNPRKARDLFAELIVKRPSSEFVPEAWIRVGEYHFDRSDDPEEIALAKHAYQQAMKYDESKFYDKALYKLAWSHYRLDDFDEAIGMFKTLVEYSDQRKAETGQSGSVLRAEAIKYIGVSLAEEDWNLDRAVDDDFGLPRVKKYLSDGKEYEREVIIELVDYLFENTRYDIASKIIRYALKKYPKHPRNPQLHEKLIIALMRPPRELDNAFEVRRKLIDYYGPDSEWYAYQKRNGNEKAVNYGDSLIRDNLIQAATWYHEQAQKLKDEARVKQDSQLLAKSQKKYKKAARAYEQFLKRYPDDKDVYKWNFYYADTLYYSSQYGDAYEQYRVVRELDLKDNKYQADAAFNAVKSLEFQLKKLADEGRIPGFVVPDGNREEAREAAQKQQQAGQAQEQREGQKEPEIEKKSIPDIVERYVTAMDRYVVLGLDYKDNDVLDARFAFNAAKIFYDFKHYETARQRFAWIVNNYPDKEEAYLAGSLILEMYRQEKKYNKLAEWAEKLENVVPKEKREQVRAEVREYKLGALFKSAEKLFNNEKYEKAAEEYIRLVDKEPDHENAPRALNNAAVAYEKMGKYASAMDLYERMFNDYPQSPLSGYALYRVGVNSERFFDFDNAVDKYLLFYEKYAGKSPQELEKMGFQTQEKRPKALLSAAVLSGNLQRYEEAARLYQRFVEQYPGNEEAPNAQWQAVENWKKAERLEKMVDAIGTYKQEFGADPEHADRVLEGMMRIAKKHENEGREDQALDQYRAIIDEFKQRELKPGTDAAFYAARSEFQLAEQKYQEWKKIKIEGSLTEQKKLLDKKIKEQKKVAKAFTKVWEYKNLEYTLAASFRRGSLFQGFAEALYAVPIPFQPGTEKYNIYRTQLEDIAIPLEDKAVAQYEKTIKKAREEKIVNEWTKKTLEELNKYRPDGYPLYKESRMAKQAKTVTGRSMMSELSEPKKESQMEEGVSPSDGGDAPQEEKGGSSDKGDNSSSDQQGKSEGASGDADGSGAEQTSSDEQADQSTNGESES